MADTEIENPLGFVDKRRVQGDAATASSGANYEDVGALRTRLAAANGALYTAALLNTMTKNDMVYALRLTDDAAGI